MEPAGVLMLVNVVFLVTLEAALSFGTGCTYLKRSPVVTVQPSPLYLHMFSFDHVVATAKVDLDKRFTSGDMSGVIERHGQKFYALVSANCEGTGTSLDGELELEKPRLPRAMGGSVLTLGQFVLSTNSDCSSFLER